VVIDSDGFTLLTPQVLTLATAVINDQALFVPQPDGTVVNLALTHNALIYDHTRNRYYASIPGSVIGQSNSIATIDAATGARAQEHTGSNLIVFDSSGQYVYGFNNETTEFGLRRIAVLGDGLAEEAVIAGAISRFSTRALDWSPQGLILETSLFRAPDLTLMGLANVSGGGCRSHSVANKLVCLGNAPGSTESWLAVVNASTFVIESTPFYRRRGAGPGDAEQVVPGPAGQVRPYFR
jgi:hypothetical protein